MAEEQLAFRPGLGIFPRERLEEVWDQVEPFLERAMEYNRDCYDVRTIEMTLQDGEMQLWLDVDDEGQIRSVIVLDMIVLPKKQFLNIAILVSNDMNAMFPTFVKTMEEYAMSLGCDGIRGAGRKGWVRMFRKYGWAEPFVTVEKMLK